MFFIASDFLSRVASLDFITLLDSETLYLFYGAEPTPSLYAGGRGSVISSMEIDRQHCIEKIRDKNTRKNLFLFIFCTSGFITF